MLGDGKGEFQRMKMQKILVVILVSMGLAAASQSTMAIPMSFNISQTGFAGGGSITGMFTGDDLDSDGAISSSDGEVSAFTASWSGNATIGATSWTLADLWGLIYELGTGDIGDDGICCGIEGIGVGPNAGGYEWLSGNGPGGFGAAPGGGIQGPTGLLITTSNLVKVQVPEPTTLALMGLGLAGIGYRRKKLKAA